MRSKTKFLSSKSLILCIQAVDIEMAHLRSIKKEELQALDEVRFVDYQFAADELKDAYEDLSEEESGLPPYSDLVKQN